MINIDISAADVNRVLAEIREASLRYEAGRIQIEKQLGPVPVSLTAYLDVRENVIRVAVPFSEITAKGAGMLVRGAAGLAWRWLEGRIEQLIGDQLEAHELPWDLVWIDQLDDPHYGKVGTINISPAVLNRWLAEQTPPDQLAPRLAGLAVGRGVVRIKLDLVARRAGDRSPAGRSNR